MKPPAGEDYTGERDGWSGRPTVRALIQRHGRQRLSLSDVEAILAAAPQRAG